MWVAQDVHAPPTRVKVYRHVNAGDVASSVTGFDLAADPELRIRVYTPVDETAGAAPPG